jgi:hypothetical protein
MVMKKFWIFLTLWLILLSVVYILNSEDTVTAEKKASNIDLQINSLIDKYGERVFHSFYSIEEIRPFSIVQIDKILELYNNTWLSPKIIMEKLNEEDKITLKTNVIGYIESFSDEKKKEYIILKLTNWCKADMQFSFINKELGVYQENIMTALQSVNIDKKLVFKYYDTKSAVNDKLTADQLDFAYYQTLNLISAMSVPEQLRYYGDLYNHIAELSK